MNDRVLFITTKNIDYLRNVQEINLLKKKGYQVDCIYSDGSNYMKRILDIYRKLLFKQVRDYKFVFIGFAPQLILPVFGWKFRHVAIYIDFFISVYDTLVNDRKKIKKGSFMAKILWHLDRKTLNRARKAVADTKAHKEYFANEFQVKEEKIHVEYLQADTKIYYPRHVEKPSEWTDKFLVLYFGSILPLQGVEVVMETIHHMRDRKDIHFLIIGPVKDSIKKVESDTVTYYNWLSQNELSDQIAMADLCLAGHFCASIDKADRTIPGKAYIYAAMDKPMILGDTVANHELYKESKKIAFVKRGDSEALEKKILDMEQDWKSRK